MMVPGERYREMKHTLLRSLLLQICLHSMTTSFSVIHALFQVWETVLDKWLPKHYSEQFRITIFSAKPEMGHSVFSSPISMRVIFSSIKTGILHVSSTMSGFVRYLPKCFPFRIGLRDAPSMESRTRSFVSLK